MIVVPLTVVPLTAGPLIVVPLTVVPLTAGPLIVVPLAALPLAAVPLTALPLTVVPLTAVPLTVVPLTAAVCSLDRTPGFDLVDWLSSAGWGGEGKLFGNSGAAWVCMGVGQRGCAVGVCVGVVQ